MSIPAKSLSKSCFAFKGKRKLISPPDDFYFNNGILDDKVSYKSYQKQWKKLETQLEDIQSDINSNLFQELLDFIKESSGIRSDSLRSIDIPAAAFITGINVPDHGPVFLNLKSVLKKEISPYVALLHAKDCNTLKNFMQITVSQIMEIKDLFDDDDDSEEGPSIKLHKCTMIALSTWYEEVVRKKEISLRKSVLKRKRHDSYEESIDSSDSPLIIILTDFENFSPPVIQDFISICSNYINRIPIVLIFGIATSVSILHKTLSQNVSSLLRMKIFQTEPPSKYLTNVLNKVILNNTLPFKLGSKTFGLLLDIFLCHDFSVSNFFNGYQICMMEHFFHNPLGILCCKPKKLSRRCENLNHEQLECFRKAASFRKYVESQPPSDQRELLLNDQHLKNVLVQLLKELHQFHNLFFPCIHLLHALISSIPQCPFGKNVREIYCKALQTQLWETDSYIKTQKLLRTVARDELANLLEKCLQSILTQEKMFPELLDIQRQLQSYLTQLKNINDQNFEDQENEDINHIGELKTNTRLQKRKTNSYEKLRNKVLDYFEDTFRKYLKSPKTLPLHEAVYFDSVSSVKKLLVGMPRTAIHVALSNPHRYLKCKCCETQTDEILSTLPDVCVAYKLHTECGHLINLYDWLQAFVGVMHPEDVDENTKQILHAQFIRSVSELQFLGFIKPTKAKTDHVARLTWGGC